ncbi:protein of unknown function DUF434 [Sediminispirochaeta smaragdinae DSM 11293]|uniref:DUF434 domain-containing protein n=2 Tax=Sediminispirochaeta TaxID=1911556 RepID=E1R360_SEDSS|nr:protein of unknown function DUF434 [Sediminispirochaeta smaragdinae DSM 11293]
MIFVMEFSKAFADAVVDYRGLLDKGYPTKATLKLVGDRYRLAKAERMILFRGVLSRFVSNLIASKLVYSVEKRSRLAVDGHNVLLTLVNYHRGLPLFIASDGLLRDAGAAFGRSRSTTYMERSISLFIQGIVELDPEYLLICLDRPVSGSGNLAQALRNALSISGVQATVDLFPSADPIVRDFEGDCITSSDSALVMKAVSPTFDLAMWLLGCRYKSTFPDIRALLNG